MLGAERIGHGLAAIQDANLLGQLQRKKIAVEICLSSNYLTGAWKDEHFHPLIRFMEAGVPCIICTDDAGIFNTDLKREYHLAAEILKRHVGISELPAALTELTENARTFAFDPKVEV
jgi:adenosine deaminase